MKLIAKLTASILLLTLLLSACVAQKEATSKETQPLTIKMCLRGSTVGLDRILQELYGMMDSENNFVLDITMIPASDYAGELDRIINSREEYDFVFEAPWVSLNRLVDHKEYMNLEQYFNSDKYPALRDAFSPSYLNANRFDGKIYAIPFTNTYWDPTGIYYRKDILKSYDLGFHEITDKEQLIRFYDEIKKRNPEMIPLALTNRGFFDINMKDMTLRSKQIYDVPGWAFYDYPSKIVLSDDGKQVLDVVFAGDDVERFSALHKGYENDFIADMFLENARLATYAQENSIFAQSGYDLFYQGRSASFESTLGTGGSSGVQKLLRKTEPNAEIGFWCYDEMVDKRKADTKMYSNMQAWNFLCIPAYSTNSDNAMRFLNWLFSKREHLELLTYGIEGEDWAAFDDNEYLWLDNSDEPFTFPAYELAWTPLYHRVERTLPEYEKDLFQYIYNTENYRLSPISGWSLNTSRISIELARLTALYKEYYMPFFHGAYQERTREKISELHTRSLGLDLETVRQEIIKQAQLFLDIQ